MKKILFLAGILLTKFVYAQQPLPVPDTLSGIDIALTMHIDSVSFFPENVTHTYAFNQYAYLGPTLILRNGDDVNISVTNHIDDTTTVHWHGLHIPAMMDGGPHTPIMQDSTWNVMFTINNHAATYWYHPHTHMQTGEHAMKGAAGLIIVKDDEEAALDLPRHYGVDDIPLVVQSMEFDTNNQVLWRGMHDSILLVNGAIDPFVNVPAQIIRLRLLDASQERSFNFGFSDNHPFYVIGNDGGLLTAPVNTTRIRLSPGERAEILIDLSALENDSLYLMSYASELPMGVQGGIVMPGMEADMYSPINGVDFNILKIKVTAPTADAVTEIPASLISFTPLNEADADTTRVIQMSAVDETSMDGPFYFNNQLFDMDRIDYTIPLNNIEIWTLQNLTMVAHPFHLHGMQFFVLDRDGTAPPAVERGFKDVVLVQPGETVRFITQFTDFPDTTMPYMYHCHILMHEDDGMMGQYVITDKTDAVTTLPSNGSYSIYPDPAHHYLIIGNDNNAPANLFVQIFSVSGELIKQIQTASNTQIPIEDLVPGFYIISIMNNNGDRSVQSLVVE